MRWIDAVLHCLQPVTVDERVFEDRASGVLPDKHIPSREERRWAEAGIGVKYSAETLDGVRNMLDSILDRAPRRLRRLFETSTCAIELPAMIGTPNPLFVDPPVCERRGAMWTMFTDQTEVPFLVAIDDQFLAESFHGANGFFFGQFRCRGHRVPVAAQPPSATCVAADLSE